MITCNPDESKIIKQGTEQQRQMLQISYISCNPGTCPPTWIRPQCAYTTPRQAAVILGHYAVLLQFIGYLSILKASKMQCQVGAKCEDTEETEEV